MSHLIYIASPYSHPDPAIRDDRFLDVTAFVNFLISNWLDKYVPFSPIVYCHDLAKRYVLPYQAENWKALNDKFILACQEVHVLMLEDWEQSKGVTAEIELAHNCGLPVRYWQQTPSIALFHGPLLTPDE